MSTCHQWIGLCFLLHEFISQKHCLVTLASFTFRCIVNPACSGWFHVTWLWLFMGSTKEKGCQSVWTMSLFGRTAESDNKSCVQSAFWGWSGGGWFCCVAHTTLSTADIRLVPVLIMQIVCVVCVLLFWFEQNTEGVNIVDERAHCKH